MKSLIITAMMAAIMVSTPSYSEPRDVPTIQAKHKAKVKPSGKHLRMVASWYQCCARTANGERFKPDGLTAAHKTLKFGTKLLVTYGNKSVVVRITDRGPFIKGRQLDLSRGAAKRLGIISKGSATVLVTILE